MIGVTAERNAASRFVDFSCVTPFEHLILALENGIKGVRDDGQERHISTYLSVDMCISMGNTTSLATTNSLRARHAGNSISHLFGYKGSFILVSRLNNSWLDGTATIKHTMFGAVITALHNCAKRSPSVTMNNDQEDNNNFPPIFVTFLSEEALATSLRCSDWQGYQIVNLYTPPTSSSTARSNRRHGSTLVTKYSSKHQNFAPLHSGNAESLWYRYVDNLQRLVEETYVYDNSYGNPTELLTTAQVTEYYRIRSHTDVSNMLLCQEGGSTDDEPTSTDHHPTHRITVHLMATLAYPPGKIDTLIDNEIHSTLAPARQSSSSWCATEQPGYITQFHTNLSSCLRASHRNSFSIFLFSQL